MAVVGVLALQGAVSEHCDMLQACGAAAVPVRNPDDLSGVSGLILPGGESTTMGRLLAANGLVDPLRRRIEDGMPVWGTCAGMILLAERVVDELPHLGLMDITVRRNAYGRQADSFRTNAVVPGVGLHPVELVFIRAPWIERTGASVEVLCSLDGHVVAARERNMLATSFHPELTDDVSFHRFFLTLVEESTERRSREQGIS